MKKVILSLSIIAIAAVSANAQVTYGAKGGLNLSTIGGADSDLGEGGDPTTRVGFNLGGFANIPLSSTFSIQPEVVYSEEGAEYNDQDTRLNLTYVNVVALAKYKLGQKFAVEAGPQIGFLTAVNAQQGSMGTMNLKDQDIVTSTNISAVLGASYAITSTIGVNARYNLGLSNIAGDNYTDAEFKSSAIQVGLSYTLNSKK